MRIAVLSDFHFGMGAGTGREEDAFEAFSEALDKTKDCDLILLGGDLFDSRNPTNETFARAMELMTKPLLVQNDVRLMQGIGKDIAKISEIALMGTPLVAIHGNHERRAKGLLNPVQALEKAGFLIYLDCNGVVFEKDGERVAIQAMSGVPEQYAGGVISEWGPKPEHGCFNIFLLHQSITEFMYAQNTMDLDNIPEGFDIYINGHMHEAEAKEYGGKPMLITGSLVPTQLKEESEKPKGFWIFETSVRDKIKEMSAKPSKTIERNGLGIHWIELENQRRMYYRKYENPGINDIGTELDKIVSENPGKKPIVRVCLKGNVKDTLVNEIETRFGGKVLLSFKKEKDPKELPTKTLEEHKLSVEEMGRKILLENLKKSGLDPKTFEGLFELLAEGKTDDVMESLMKIPAKTGKPAETKKDAKKTTKQSRLFPK